MVIGTLGMKLLTGWPLIESFYFMAMIATAEGPPQVPPNAPSMVFAAIMAFISIGTLITAVGIIFGPFLGYVFHKGVAFAEKEINKKKQQEEEEKAPKREGLSSSDSMKDQEL